MKKLLFILALIFASHSYTKNIIWDLGGTLFKYDTSYLSTKIDKWNYSMYSLFDGKGHEDLVNKTFDILGLIDGHQDAVCRENGSSFPQAFVNWQLGIYTAQEIYDTALMYIEELKKDDEQSDSKREFLFYCSKGEYLLVKNTLDILLTPTTLAKSMKPVKKMVNVLKRCSEIPGNTMFVLSNWDKESFKCLQNNSNSQEVFTYFKPEHIIISGNVGHVKPHKDMYDYVTKKFKLDPKECIFIDDQEENIIAAQACGMHTVFIKDKSIKEITEELEKLGAFVPATITTQHDTAISQLD